MTARTDRKIAAARKVAETLPPLEAQVIRDLCHAHAAASETLSRLWHDNAALRRDMASINRCPALPEAQRIAGRHVSKEPEQ
jgi:hypothetical protein